MRLFKRYLNSKKIIIFVGSFQPRADDGTIGGQMFACRSLIESPLSSFIEWRLIDSTMKSLPPPNVVIRSLYALIRLSKFVYYIVFDHIDGILIFTPYVPSSLLEKGLMCILGNVLDKRVVLSLRSEIHTQLPDRYFKYFNKVVIQNTKAIICQSNVAAESLVQSLGCKDANIVVIPNWIDSEMYRQRESNRSLRLTGVHQPTILFMGWLEQYKGVNELLDAACLLVEEGLPFRLVICGSGPLREALKQRCAQFGLERHVEFLGWVAGETKLKAFRESDIFVLPSFSEGFPNALLEAMAAGLAVVATPVGGIVSVIESGHNGLLVKPGDHVGLAQALRELVFDPELVKRMGEINRMKIAENHDITHVWRKIAEVLCIDIHEDC